MNARKQGAGGQVRGKMQYLVSWLNSSMRKVPFNLPYIAGKEAQYFKTALESLPHCGNQTFGQRCIELLKTQYGFLEVYLNPSCTAAMEMGALLGDLQPEDEVILPSYAFSSTANAVVLRGAKPVFCDVGEETMNIDVEHIPSLVTKNTKMIVPIDYAGIPCDIDHIMNIADQHKLLVMQDAAQSLHSYHSNNRACGSVPHMAAFSFHESKNISCGEGGALVVNDPSLLERASFLQEKGTDRSLVLQGVKNKYSWVDVGSSFLLSDLLSAPLLAQLEIAGDIVRKRRPELQAYDTLFNGYEKQGCLSIPHLPDGIQHNHHAYFVVFDSNEHRGKFLDFLKERQVVPYIGYLPLHSSPFGLRLGYQPSDLPVTEDLASRIVRMPVYTALAETDLTVDLSVHHLTRYHVVGLPDTAVRESGERVKAAIRNCGYQFPRTGAITVNLAPADFKKEGSCFDLPIALAILGLVGDLAPEKVQDWLILGELSLDGRVRPIRGALPVALSARRKGFQRLLEFASRTYKVSPSALFLEQIDAQLVSAFLEYLEQERGNSPQTRNARLAAIKSFMRFVEHRVPSSLDQIRRILAIPSKKTTTRLTGYLTSQELQALLDAPQPNTWNGIRDRAMLHITFAAGLRVSELVGLQIDDLTFQPRLIVRIRGKGRRERALPLWQETAHTLRAWLAIRGQPPVPEIFLNARGLELTRSGFAYILSKHIRTAARQQPSLLAKRVSPHVLRHTCAMVILRATHDIRKVSLWLGHASLQSTEVYVQADPSEKLEALEAATPPSYRRGRFEVPDRLLALLQGSTRLCAADMRKTWIHRAS